MPRVDLYDSTKRDLLAVGFNEKDIHIFSEQEGKKGTDRLLALITDPGIDWKSGRNQCIITYQALTLLVKSNPEMRDFIRSHFDVVIEDEAHRGIGKKTKQAVGSVSL